MLRHLIFCTFLVFLVVNSYAQGTKKQPGFIKQQYHNTTSRYNGYFNGNEKLIEILDQLALAHVDNYSDLLDVFPLGDKQAALNTADQSDIVIKKASFVIQRHEIGKWVDDCYIMIGKAYYYKADYFTAIESFQYVFSKYEGNPTEVEALIWLARCYLKLNKLSQAESSLTLAQSKFAGARTRHLLKDYHVAFADYLIKVKNYRKGTEELLNALAYNTRRYERARLNYIVAQLYEQQGKNERAIIFFKRVIRKTPPYEMVFNARISIARLYDISEESSGKGVEATLNRMLKDEKNKDFKDQLYFTLGKIALKKGEIPEAIGYFRLSAQNSTTNTKQKALSYLTIADLYFDKVGNFEQAGSFYDSTLSVLPKDYPDYEKISFRRNNLDKLIENSAVIAKEDSLQRIAQLDPDDRKKLIDKLARARLAEIKQAEQRKIQQTVNLADGNTGNNDDATDKAADGSSSSWYFYNAGALGIGYSEFLKRWGRRPLEDNWRRSNKENINTLQPDEPDSTQQIATTTAGTDINNIKETLLKDVPLTRDQVNLSNDRLIEAYWNLGNIYKEQLRDPKNAIRIFDTLNTRFPRNKYTLETLYQLYRIYESKEDKNNSIAYEQRILIEYPTSIYAEIIRNPDYAAKANIKLNKLNELYETAYNYYLQENYTAVLSLKSDIAALEPEPEAAARYAYLEAQTIGKTRSKEEYLEALRNVQTNYADTNAGKIAGDNLTYFSTEPKP